MAAYYLPQNAGAIARKYIQDPQLLSFIDAEVDTIIQLVWFSQKFHQFVKENVKFHEELFYEMCFKWHEVTELLNERQIYYCESHRRNWG